MSEHQQIKDLEERFARGEISRREFMIAISALGVTFALGISPTNTEAATKTVAMSGTASGFGPYVEDVFSTYTYTGNGTKQTINNGIALGDTKGTTDQQAFTTPGTHSWICPAGVTSVSVVCVGPGGQGGGALGYKNNITVVPGNSYTVEVGVPSVVSATDSYFISPSTVRGGGGCAQGNPAATFTGDGGGNGGTSASGCGGGGAGGYSGSGGSGQVLSSGGAGSGGGGGAGGYFYDGNVTEGGAGGGGVGILGAGTSGAGGTGGNPAGGATGGLGGSAGTAGGNYTNAGNSASGGSYGGGRQGYPSTPGTPGGGAVRIIWPGTTRSFPSTNTGDVTPIGVVPGNGGLVWIKGRSGATPHNLIDTLRGATNRISTNSTAGSSNDSGSPSFNSNGFTIDITSSGYGQNGETYASWTFRRAANFFDVVTYTGNGANRTISHSLGSAPGMIIVKRTDSAGFEWDVWHRSFSTPASNYMWLNSTATMTSSSSEFGTAPTSSVFSVNTSSRTNTNAATYVAYLFAHNPTANGIIQCGTYTGNSTLNSITTGWEPQYVLIKRVDTAVSSWMVLDSVRGFTVGSSDNALCPDNSNAEGATASVTNAIRPTATGFDLLNANSALNVSGSNYIYMAIRRGPMRTPTAGTQVYNAITRSGTGASATVTGTGFVPDAWICKNRTSTGTVSIADRLRGSDQRLGINTTLAEDALGGNNTFSVTTDGVPLTTLTGSDFNSPGNTYINWFFRRAPGFFDEVCYTGTGSARTISHNLTVGPELVIVHRRDSAQNWGVLATTLSTPNNTFNFNGTSGAFDGSSWWGAGSATGISATTFGAGSVGENNTNGGTYVAYLFASCPGVSKIGTYTGNGSATGPIVTTSFQPRWLMVKRTDSTGNWCVWDSTRSTSNPRQNVLFLNSTAAETASGYDVDFNATGFQIKSTSTDVNANTGTYLYFAIS